MKKFLVLLIPFWLFASWDEAALAGLSAILSAKQMDKDGFKSSIKTAINSSATTLSTTDFARSNFDITLPSYITDALKSMPKEKAASLKKPIQDGFNEGAKQGAIPAARVLTKAISNMSDTQTELIMSGQSTLSDYLKANSFDELMEVVSPILDKISSTPSFQKAYNELLGDSPTPMSKAVTEAIFDSFMQGERMFKTNPATFSY